jgi:hypothetical protein
MSTIDFFPYQPHNPRFYEMTQEERLAQWENRKQQRELRGQTDDTLRRDYLEQLPEEQRIKLSVVEYALLRAMTEDGWLPPVFTNHQPTIGVIS